MNVAVVDEAARYSIPSDSLGEGCADAINCRGTVKEAMTSVSLFERVILLRDLPAEGLRAGDVGNILERHPASGETSAGCEVEFFAANGETVLVASVPVDGVRPATERDLLCVRALTFACD